MGFAAFAAQADEGAAQQGRDGGGFHDYSVSVNAYRHSQGQLVTRIKRNRTRDPREAGGAGMAAEGGADRENLRRPSAEGGGRPMAPELIQRAKGRGAKSLPGPSYAPALRLTPMRTAGAARRRLPDVDSTVRFSPSKAAKRSCLFGATAEDGPPEVRRWPPGMGGLDTARTNTTDS
jgi:hypothetical protein